METVMAIFSDALLEECRGRKADIYGARIRIGKKTTVQSCLHISADKANVDIVEDNMFSHFVKISTVCHKLIGKRIGMDITNRKAVKA